MTGISPALERAHYLLRNDMLGYIDQVEWLTNESDQRDEVILAVARTEVPRLVSAIRGTIRDHTADAFGLCLRCPSTWLDGRLTRQQWPCPVIDELHRFAQDPDSIYDRAGDDCPLPR